MMPRMSGSALEFDVAVIGAGAAGLCAAAQLCASGRTVALLEARDRIGGRIDSRALPELDWPIELGAEFVHGDAPVTRSLLQAAGLAIVDTSGRHAGRRSDGGEIRDSLFAQARELLAPARELAQDQSVEQFLLACGAAQEPIAAFVRAMVEGFDAADPRRASVRAIAAEWCGDSLQAQGRPLGGYAPLLAALRRQLTPSRAQILLGTRVEAIEWGGASVRIAARRGEHSVQVHATRAVIALPLSILQLPADAPGAVRFEPPLTDKRVALQGLALGPVIKVVMYFRQSFWEQWQHGEFADAGFLRAPAAPFPTLWTALPFRVPVLTAWMGGPRAQALQGASREQLIDQALASVRQALDWPRDPLDELVAAHMHDWSSDEYSRGAYSYIAVGGEDAPRLLAEPLRERLFFAGEATDPDNSGTVEAALQSGQSAAERLLASASIQVRKRP